MRINGQEFTSKVATSSAYAAQRVLKGFGLLDCVCIQQIMEALIGSDKRHTVEDFEAFLAEATGGAQVYDSQCGLMHKLQAQTAGKIVGGRAGPLLQKIPGAQAQVFRSQEPKANEIPGDSVGQQLADAAFNADYVGFFAAIFSGGPEGLDLDRGSLRVELIEFFFEAQSGR